MMESRSNELFIVAIIRFGIAAALHVVSLFWYLFWAFWIRLWGWLDYFLNRIARLWVFRFSIHDSGPEVALDDYAERLSLDEMRRYFDAVDKSADTLTKTAHQLIANASLVLGLMATLQISLIDVHKQPPLYWIGLYCS